MSACDRPAPEPSDAEARFTTWTRYEGEPGATSFSGLAQINRSNVDQLEVAWTYASPGVRDINPLIVDSIMYVVGEFDALRLYLANPELTLTPGEPVTSEEVPQPAPSCERDRCRRSATRPRPCTRSTGASTL